jgi:hypothetical protein
MASLTFSLLAAPDAYAQSSTTGSYAATYGGGTVAVTAGNGTAPSPAFSIGHDYSGATSTTIYYGAGPSSGGVVVDKTPALTASLAWVPASGQTAATDPAPTAAILYQYSDASAGMNSQSGAGAGSGTASCGLPGAVNTTTATSMGSVATYYSAATVSAGGGITAPTCGATATFSGSVGMGSRDNVTGSAGEDYDVEAFPVFLNLTGLVKDSSGNLNLLTGQQCSANLSIGANQWGITFPGTVTKYSWSGQSGTCFKTYNPNIQPPANNQLAPLASTDLSGADTSGKGISVSPLAFYDSAAETLTLTCKVTLTNPDGSTLNVTAASPQITMEKPTASWSIYTGSVLQVYDTSQNQGGFGLEAVPGSGQMGGEAWQKTTIVLPTPFTATGGLGCFAQLVTPDVEVSNDNPAMDPTFPNNKQQGLDNSFPYVGYTWNVSGTGANADSPEVLFENYNSGGYAGWNKVLTNQVFTTWVMYQPPGGVWVPVQSYGWTWSFTSTWSSTNDVWKEFRASPTSDPGYTGTSTPAPPQWSLVQNNTPAPAK